MQGDIISLDMQLKNYQITLSQINNMLGNRNTSTAEYLSKCIFSVAIGTNDYIANYFSPFYTTRRIYTPQQYAVVLNQQLSQQLQVSKLHLHPRIIICFAIMILKFKNL